MKTSVSIAELKARLSEHLRRVKSGDEIVITDRGAPVARIVPLDAAERRATRRDRLATAGLLRPGKGRARKALLTAPAGEAVGTAIVDLLVRDRSDSSSGR